MRELAATTIVVSMIRTGRRLKLMASTPYGRSCSIEAFAGRSAASVYFVASIVQSRRAIELLRLVGLPDAARNADRFPTSFRAACGSA